MPRPKYGEWHRHFAWLPIEIATENGVPVRLWFVWYEEMIKWENEHFETIHRRLLQSATNLSPFTKTVCTADIF